MNWKRRIRAVILPQICCFLLQPYPALAQQDRLTTINRTQVTTLRGNVNQLARPDSDRGRIDTSRQLSNLSIMFRPSTAQQAALDRLLASQQDPASPNYHVWLTPEDFADRFGLSQPDIDKISAWLRREGVSIADVARSRNWIAFTGTAGQVERACHTELHEYLVSGERHYANRAEPSVPAAVAPLVLAISGLDDFRPTPAHVKRSISRMTPEY